ncbi:MAG: protein translocase subunit SecF [Ignavibacteriaceae bacterium]|jgi:preprotein translocase subunit SecF|nr:protein translocase subunit SecF [Ignavibacteriaceae bacterium]HPO56531.1 protein translocase subunit SecF [Ignavibacteriaceae bacterium]
MRIFENLNIDWLGKRRFFYILSAVVFLAGLLSVIFKGIGFGIDFKGGSEIVFQFEKTVEISQVRDEISKLGLGNVEIKTFGGETGILVRTELQEIPANIYPRVKNEIEKTIYAKLPGLPMKLADSTVGSVTYSFENADTASTVADLLFSAGFQAGRESSEETNSNVMVRIGIADWIKINLKDKHVDNPFSVLREDRVGPKVGKELQTDALLAVLLSLVVILIYLGFRFKFIFGLGAVIALFHDVLITFGLFSLLYGVIPGLNLDIDLTIVAAFLTLVGYSINDTVIVFDRVRENLKIHKNADLQDQMNKSINRTMSRTILTGGTTLLTVLVLLLFGGEVLRAFAFTLFFGIIIGTYSSIFVASALVLDYASSSNKKIEF